MSPSGEVIPVGLRLAYAGPAFALALIGIPIYVFIPKFYTDVVGVEIAWVGSILLVLRVVDAVTDPLVGSLSDRTRTRFGRRRPWILGGSVPLAVVVLLLFVPPDTTPGLSTLWFAVLFFTVFLFWTAVIVPYEALGAEISFDHDERTSLLGLRDGMLIAGTLLAASSPVLVAWAFGLPDGAAGERAKFLRIGLGFGPLLIGACLVCAARVPERPRRPARREPAIPALRTMLSNRPFAVLLAAYTIAALGSNLPATLILYYVEYILESDRAELFLLLYFVAGILFLPAWVALAKRIGKKRAWLVAMGINTGAFVGVLFLGSGDGSLYGILVTLSGIGFGATLAIPSSMQADVIDYGELLSGERREGQYVGVWNVAKKLAAALGVGISLSVLGTSGYAPNVEQTPTVKLTLKILYAGIPSLLNVVAMLVVLAYPIDRIRHQQILKGVKARRRGIAATDPLRPGMLLPDP
jgi:GPH family glycoside/pentoside/hexuronide:cation symporter